MEGAHRDFELGVRPMLLIRPEPGNRPLKDTFQCLICNARNSWSSDRCTVCKTDLGAPLRRELLGQEEKDALAKRYQAAWEDATAQGFADLLKSFEDQVQSNSVATISVWPAFLDQILDDSALYSGYTRLVASEIRWPAMRSDDRARMTVEWIMFGSLASDIRYAALSVDGAGPASYGNSTIVLRELTVKDSATLLEDNSYKFVRDHQLTFDIEIPAGYRAVWQDRHMLAVSKLAKKVGSGQTPTNAAGILLFSEGDRQTDDFIEVHIWGAFDHQSIEGVRIPHPERAPDHEQAILLRIRDRMIHREQRCDLV
jgi:hypothetical protein